MIKKSILALVAATGLLISAPAFAGGSTYESWVGEESATIFRSPNLSTAHISVCIESITSNAPDNAGNALATSVGVSSLETRGAAGVRQLAAGQCAIFYGEVIFIEADPTRGRATYTVTPLNFGPAA